MTTAARAKFFVFVRIVSVEGGNDVLTAHAAEIKANTQASERGFKTVFHFDRNRLDGAHSVDNAPLLVSQADGDGDSERALAPAARADVSAGHVKAGGTVSITVIV